MELLKLYERDPAGGFVLDRAGAPKVCAIHINSIPRNGRQHFSTALVKNAISQGWGIIKGDMFTLLNSERVYKLDSAGAKVLDDSPVENDRKYIVLGTKRIPGDVVFTIARLPGRYCCHCGEVIDEPNISSGEISRAHVSEYHPGVKSPNPEWPAGYEVTNYYDCVVRV